MTTLKLESFIIRNRIGGGVSESNQPKTALTISQTVLKTAPFTGTDAPPRENRVIKVRRFCKIMSSFFARVLKYFSARGLLDRLISACYSFYFETGAFFRSIIKQPFN